MKIEGGQRQIMATVYGVDDLLAKTVHSEGTLNYETILLSDFYVRIAAIKFSIASLVYSITASRLHTLLRVFLIHSKVH